MKKRCRFPPIRDLDFFSSEVSDSAGRKRLSHGKGFNAGADGECNATQCKAMQRSDHVAAPVKRNAAAAVKSFVGEKNLFFLSIDGFPPAPFRAEVDFYAEN